MTPAPACLWGSSQSVLVYEGTKPVRPLGSGSLLAPRRSCPCLILAGGGGCNTEVLGPVALCSPSPSSSSAQSPSWGGGPGAEPPPLLFPTAPQPCDFPVPGGNCVIQALRDPGVSSGRMLQLLRLPISTRQRRGASPGAGTPESPPGRPGARPQPLIPPRRRPFPPPSAVT